MSPIGRIFVVVNLALAAVFLGWASSTLANAHKYRGQYEAKDAELQQTKTTLQEEIATLSAARDEARRQKEQVIEQKAALDTQKKGLDLQIQSLTDEKNLLTQHLAGIDATLEGYGAQSTRLAQDLKAAAADQVAANNARRDAENAREKALQAQRDAEAALAQAQRDIRDRDVQLADANEELGRRDTIIEAFKQETGLSEAEVGGNVPTIQAAVVGVMQQADLTLVHLNKGSNDGIKRGYTVWVYSGATLKGKARVEVVNDATSTAVMVDPVDGRVAAQGDRASTRL